MVNRIYHDVPFYRNKFQEKGLMPEDVRSLDDLQQLPFTTKVDLRDNYPYGLRYRWNRSSVSMHHQVPIANRRWWAIPGMISQCGRSWWLVVWCSRSGSAFRSGMPMAMDCLPCLCSLWAERPLRSPDLRRECYARQADHDHAGFWFDRIDRPHPMLFIYQRCWRSRGLIRNP